MKSFLTENISICERIIFFAPLEEQSLCLQQLSGSVNQLCVASFYMEKMVSFIVREFILDKGRRFEVSIRNFLHHWVDVFRREWSFKIVCTEYFQIKVDFFGVFH